MLTAIKSQNANTFVTRQGAWQQKLTAKYPNGLTTMDLIDAIMSLLSYKATGMTDAEHEELIAKHDAASMKNLKSFGMAPEKVNTLLTTGKLAQQRESNRNLRKFVKIMQIKAGDSNAILSTEFAAKHTRELLNHFQKTGAGGRFLHRKELFTTANKTLIEMTYLKDSIQIWHFLIVALERVVAGTPDIMNMFGMLRPGSFIDKQSPAAANKAPMRFNDVVKLLGLEDQIKVIDEKGFLTYPDALGKMVDTQLFLDNVQEIVRETLQNPFLLMIHTEEARKTRQAGGLTSTYWQYLGASNHQANLVSLIWGRAFQVKEKFSNPGMPPRLLKKMLESQNRTGAEFQKAVTASAAMRVINIGRGSDFTVFTAQTNGFAGGILRNIARGYQESEKFAFNTGAMPTGLEFDVASMALAGRYDSTEFRELQNEIIEGRVQAPTDDALVLSQDVTDADVEAVKKIVGTFATEPDESTVSVSTTAAVPVPTDAPVVSQTAVLVPKLSNAAVIRKFFADYNIADLGKASDSSETVLVDQNTFNSVNLTVGGENNAVYKLTVVDGYVVVDGL